MLGWFKRVPQANPDEVREALRGGALVVDVRERHEFAAGHVPGARHVPLNKLSREASKFSGGRRIYTICAHGSRSKAAARMLTGSGIDAVSVKGGMRGWRLSGGPVSKGGRR